MCLNGLQSCWKFALRGRKQALYLPEELKPSPAVHLLTLHTWVGSLFSLLQMAGQAKSTWHSRNTRYPLLLLPVAGNLAGEWCREQASSEARLKEVYGSAVVYPCLCENSSSKSSQPLNEEDVNDTQLCTKRNYLLEKLNSGITSNVLYY